MIRVVRRLAAKIAFVVGLAMLVALPAHAADVYEVAISDVSSDGTSVTGVMTFRSAAVVDVDPGSVTVTIGGRTLPVTVEKSTHLQRTVMLVIDTSGSMGTSGMATVRAATRAFLKEAPEDVRVGVVTFADTAGVDLKPTRDRGAVQRVVDGLVARGNTSLYAAVAAGIKTLGQDGDRSMVLLSDGADTMSKDRAAELIKLTNDLRKQGVRVDVVRFKTNDPDASSALQAFATASGGSVIAAADADAVGAAFQTAARALKSQVQFLIKVDAPISGLQTIELAGRAEGQPFTVRQSVDVQSRDNVAPSAPVEPDVAAVPPPEIAFKAPSDQSRVPLVAAGTVALALFLLAFGVLTPTFETRRERRLAAIDNYVSPVRRLSRSEGKSHSTPIAEQLVGLGERAMKGRKSTARTMELINRADLPLRPGEWWVLSAVAVIVGTALGILLLSQVPLVGSLLGAVLGLAVPQVVLRILAARRAKAFERVLPDSLMLVSTSLKSGFGLPQALDAVARDAPEPVAKEFSRALAETRIGTDIADALERVAERMDSDAMRMTVMAIRIQRDVGGNLAETLGSTAKTLREREALERQVRALSAEGRLSAYILIALPFGLFFYMMLTTYDYIRLLWTTLPGIAMSVGAMVMLVVGIFWMRKVVRIEV